MQRGCELAIFPISPLHKARLYNAGYQNTSDLENADAAKLSKDTGLSLEVCKIILTDINKHDPGQRQPGRLSSATVLYQKENHFPGIVTFSEKIDTALGGGIQLGRLTEICGIPGIGKTQLCMQLACDVQIPSIFGGLDSEAIFIETERTLIIERLRDIVRSTVQHCQQIASSEDGEELSVIRKEFTEERMLSKIHCYSCRDYQHLLATINTVPEFLKEHENVKLLVLDSVSFHFRHSFEDMSLRTRLLTTLAQNLVKMARQHNIAVVVTNQMTTKVGEKTSKVIPALGESWGHACGTRIILQWAGNQRVAWLYKSPSQRQQKVPFQITTDGIRDIVDEVQEQNNDSCEEIPLKRQKIS